MALVLNSKPKRLHIEIDFLFAEIKREIIEVKTKRDCIYIEIEIDFLDPRARARSCAYAPGRAVYSGQSRFPAEIDFSYRAEIDFFAEEIDFCFQLP